MGSPSISPHLQEPYDAASINESSKEHAGNIGVQEVGDTDAAGADGERLRRSLKSRQVSMLALGGAIGTGLIIGSGAGLAHSGPVGLLISYMLVGSLCFAMLVSLCEMAAFLPHQKGFVGHATRFVGPSFGATLGFAYWIKYLIQAPTQFVAGAIIINYWIPSRHVSNGVWITVFIVLTALIHTMPVRVFGEFEFWCSSIKIATLLGLMILSLVIDAGGGPNHGYIGFRTWRELPFVSYLEPGAVGRLIGFWTGVTGAVYSYVGSEMVGVAVGEMRHPSKSISRAVRACFYRIVFLYCGSIFCVGLIVPANSHLLLAANKASTNANASPFVVAISLAGIKGLPHVINAAALIFVVSAASSDVYTTSRTGYALADGNLPKFFTRTNRFGTPWVSVLFSLSVSTLAFTATKTSAYAVFQYFVATVTLFGTIVWMQILYSNLRFRRACRLQGVSLEDLPYRSTLNPYLCYWGLGATMFISLTKGFASFIHVFNYKTFITNYIAFPAVIITYIVLSMFRYKSWQLPLSQVDLRSGSRTLQDLQDEMDDGNTPPKKTDVLNWVKYAWNS